MKALYTTGPEAYDLADRPVPIPAAGEALVKVAAAGFCMNDMRIRQGSLRPPYPLVPGHQFAGVIEACGSAVKYIRPGDRVAVHSYVLCGQCPSCRRGGVHDCDNFEIIGLTRDGGLAEYCAVPERCLFKLPDHVTLVEGSLVENLANAIAVTRVGRLQVGERVVIIGATPIGLQALQVAGRYSPSTLLLAGAGRQRLALAEQLGATHTIDLDQPDAAQQIGEVLGGRGADVVLVCGYERSAAELGVSLAGSMGRIVIEGHFDPAVELTISPFRQFVARAASLQANRGWAPPDFARAHEWLSTGQVQVQPIITHTFALRDWQPAFETFTSRESQAAQVLLTP